MLKNLILLNVIVSKVSNASNGKKTFPDIKGKTMRNAIVLAAFVLCQTAFGLQSPYLYDAVSVGDTAVQLTWRNNSVDYKGVIILKKPGSGAQFSPVDTAAGTATSFTDYPMVASTTPYMYALTAYSLTEHADTSNTDTVTVAPKNTDIFVAPQQVAVSYDTLFHTALVWFSDSSNVETGYRIFKSTGFSAFQMIKDIVSSLPAQKGIISYIDSAVTPNTWYQYYIATYKNQQSLNSDTNFPALYTFDLNAMVRSIPKKWVLSNRLADFPLNYKGWSLKSGDTIVLNETNVPDSTMFSMIDVSNPRAPKFAGTGKSRAATLGRRWEQTGYVPPSLTKGPYIFGSSSYDFQTDVFDSIICYKYSLGEIKVVSKIPAVCELSSDVCFAGFLSDSVFIVRSYQFPNKNSIIQYSFNGVGLAVVDSARLVWTASTMAPLVSYVNKDWTYKGNYFSYVKNIPCVSWYKGICVQGTPDTIAEIIDFTYSHQLSSGAISYDQWPYVWSFVNGSSTGIPIIVDGVLVEAPALESANNVFVDTAKSLAFVVSDSQLSIYSCVTTGISRGIPLSPVSGPALHVGGANVKSLSIIYLPPHDCPASVSIYNLSGKLVQYFPHIHNESIAWHHENKTGVYIIKATIAGMALSTRIILAK